MDPVKLIEQATAFASEKVKGVSADDLSKPTPCSEFDVRALLNHMIGGLDMLTQAAEGRESAMPEGDQFENDPAAEYDKRRTALLESLRAEGVLDQNWQMPFGALPGSMMASIALWENLTHAWDVAKATGQDTTLPDDLVAQATEIVKPMDQMIRMPGVCGPAVSVPDDASAQDKLIAFLGRQP